MMKATDHWDQDHVTFIGRFDFARPWRVPIERQVSSAVVIVLQVLREDPMEMGFAEHDHMIQTIAA